MFYLKFMYNNGSEHNVSCDSYTLRPRDNYSWTSVSIYNKEGHRDMYENTFALRSKDHPDSNDITPVSMFVMNENGKTIDKVVYAELPKEDVD